MSPTKKLSKWETITARMRRDAAARIALRKKELLRRKRKRKRRRAQDARDVIAIKKRIAALQQKRRGLS